ncbi:site-specific integrase, partial [Actinoplanes sp. TFC3]|uniref:site-specific integrase n=1 Tax=Actinoplanes sp. TFC3 TaxID=1710355 RepID=UPI000A53DF83
ANLDWADLDAETVSAFLNYLEDERGNSTRTRNARLTAIRSLFSYAALQHPSTPCSSSVSWTSRPSGSTNGSSPS